MPSLSGIQFNNKGARVRLLWKGHGFDQSWVSCQLRVCVIYRAWPSFVHKAMFHSLGQVQVVLAIAGDFDILHVAKF